MNCEPKQPGLSVVIETINAAPGQYGRLDEVIEALTRQTLPREEFEIIIVLDPLDHPELGRHLYEVSPHARILYAPGQHYFAQKNLGARAARGEIVGFIDSDCVPALTWAASMLEAFSRNGAGLGAVQGAVWTDKTALGCAFMLLVFPNLQSRAERRIKILAANTCAFRRADLLETPFEEEPVFHGPDVKMAARVIEQGKYILLVPGAANHHRFFPGLKLFFLRGVYWGYCFLELRRRARPSVRYARFFRRLGPLAPFVLAPAKAALDVGRLMRRRADFELGFRQTIACAAALLLNSVAVAIGAARSCLRFGPPASADSSGLKTTLLSRSSI